LLFLNFFYFKLNKQHEGGLIFLMPGVRVREEETFERALKRFKKACEKAGIISEMKKHQHYEKPSERKKRKLNASKRKRMKLEKMFSR
jgi:small subunit ribosomal protein S21